MIKRVDIVIYSGGMDSYTVLHTVVQELTKSTVRALTFDYGQRHVKEIQYAARECVRLQIHHKVVDLRCLSSLLQGSALTTHSIEMPEGHYAAETMRATVVPGRNAIMLSIAAAYAESLCMTEGFDHAEIWYGAHAGDHHIYPDCRPDFVDAMSRTIKLSSAGKVTLHTPCLNGTKSTILKEGLAAGYDYSRTWTCYEGGRIACGKCGSCQERLAAFRDNGVEDPLDYVTREIV